MVISPNSQAHRMKRPDVFQKGALLPFEREPSGLSPIPKGSIYPNLDRLQQTVRIPARDEHYFIPPDIELKLMAAVLRAEKGQILNILLVGEPGTGKSSLPEQLAASTGRPYFAFDCGAVRQVTDWWGNRELEGNRTVFYPSALVYALSIGGAIILLDEINRTPAAHLNALLPLLDHRRETYLTMVGEQVTVGRGTLIFGSANLGQHFAGTFKMDRALKDRIPSVITLAAPDTTQLTQIVIKKTGCDKIDAKKLVEIMYALNQVVGPYIGMRHLLEAGHYLMVGLSLCEACSLTLESALACEGNDDTAVSQITKILKGILG